MSIAHGATISVAAEAANARAVTIQLTDSMRKALQNRATVELFFSSDSAGLEAVQFTGDDTVPTVGAKGSLVGTAGGFAKVVSDADGAIDLIVTNASDQAKTRYLNLVLGSGHVLAPVALAFADNTP
jgi:hypothetical protein